MKVRVYFNLHTHKWSVQANEGPRRGRVIANLERLSLRDAEFVVSQVQRATCHRKGKRTVHADCRGTLIDFVAPPPGAVEVTYSPWRPETTFTVRGTTQAVGKVARVSFDTPSRYPKAW